MSEKFGDAKYKIVLATDGIARANASLIEALIRDNHGSIGSRLIAAERYLTIAMKDISTAFASLEKP